MLGSYATYEVSWAHRFNYFQVSHAFYWCTDAGRENSYGRILEGYPVSLVVLIHILVVHNGLYYAHQLFTMM